MVSYILHEKFGLIPDCLSIFAMIGGSAKPKLGFHDQLGPTKYKWGCIWHKGVATTFQIFHHSSVKPCFK